MIISRSVVAVLLLATPALAQPIDPFPKAIPATEGAVKVSFTEFATLPDVDGEAARMMLLVDEPGTRRLFVNDMPGILYTVSYDGKSVTPYLDLRLPPAVLESRHARIRQVLHLRRHRQHRAGA